VDVKALTKLIIVFIEARTVIKCDTNTNKWKDRAVNQGTKGWCFGL